MSYDVCPCRAIHWWNPAARVEHHVNCPERPVRLIRRVIRAVRRNRR